MSNISSSANGSRRAILELVAAAILWGFSFVASRWALAGADALFISATRFLGGFLIALPIILAPRFSESRKLEQLWLAMPAGLFIGASVLLQTYGLVYTQVSRSGFITCLYIVFVPLLEGPVFGTRLKPIHLFWVLLALVGAAFVCRATAGAWNRGDFLTVGCALMAAFQILSLEWASTRIRSSFVFNVYQALWAGLLPLVAFLVLPHHSVSWPLPPLSLAGIAILAVPATLVAFMLQVRSQRVLSPSVASMLFLLESPFAALFAYLCFSERLAPEQWFGAILILAAAAGTIRFSGEKPVAALPETTQRVE